MLTERRAAILGMVVNEYISTAEPVSSRAIVARHRLDLSTATIRNELARLEEEGYITQPYTSASGGDDRAYVHRAVILPEAPRPHGSASRR